MVEQEQQVVRLKDDFYRDGFYKVLFALLTIAAAVACLILTCLYLFFSKPFPIQFATDDEWRVVAPVPDNKPYLSSANLLQWVGETIPAVLSYDFVNYEKQQTKAMQYFTENGQKAFADVLNAFINQDNVQNLKLFVSATPNNAPIILNQGILDGRYGWWVQMSLNINYVSIDKTHSDEVKVQALVVRVPLLNNLDGVSIDNIIVTKA